MIKTIIRNKEVVKYNYCVMCGAPLSINQVKCCSKECNGKRYYILIKVRAIRNLITDKEFKLLLNQNHLELLVFAHIHNNGNIHRKESNIAAGTQTYVWINNNIDESKELFEVISYKENMLREIYEHEKKIKDNKKSINNYRFKVECDMKCSQFDVNDYLCSYNSNNCRFNAK